MYRLFARASTPPHFPQHDIFDTFADHHLLIAGSTGSGKSVALNGIIYNIANTKSSADVNLILCDPKKVELNKWRKLPHTLEYADTPETMGEALDKAIDIMMSRYSLMKRGGLVKWNGSRLVVVVDELADLMLTNKKKYQPKLQRLLQLGRASNVYAIGCTQAPNRRVIDAVLQVNFVNKLGLHCENAIESRQIINESGLEKLELYGTGILKKPGFKQKVTIPMYSDIEIERLLNYY